MTVYFPPDTDWAVGELVTDTDWERNEANIKFLFQHLHIYKARNSLVMSTDVNTAGLEYVTSSVGDTLKPGYHQLVFDPDSDEYRMWEGSAWFASTDISGIKVRFSMDTDNSSASVVLRTQLAALSDGDITITAKGFDTDNDATVTVPDTENELDECTIPMTNLDSVAVGDQFILILGRLGSDSDDSAVGNMLVRSWRFYV